MFTNVTMIRTSTNNEGEQNGHEQIRTNA